MTKDEYIRWAQDIVRKHEAGFVPAYTNNDVMRLAEIVVEQTARIEELRTRQRDPLDEALNSGDGVYRP